MYTTTQTEYPVRYLYIMTGVLCLTYLAVVMSLPTVPVFVVSVFHFDNVFGGIAVGAPFLATIVTRGWAGIDSDRLGGKVCTQRGLIFFTLASAICLVSALPGINVQFAYVILILGRLMLGLGLSMCMVGTLSWSVGLFGAARSGQIMSWLGAGMYAAFAVGAPLGLALFHRAGFAGLMAVCTVFPILGLLIVHRLPVAEPVGKGGKQDSFFHAVRLIWIEGVALALGCVSVAGLGAFLSFHFASQGWAYTGLGLALFGIGYIVIRIFFGSLPDKIGSTSVAVVSLIIGACGQYMMWLAPSVWPALVGAFLTGAGCSMVFPSLGAQVVKKVPAQMRGKAFAGFSAFLDLSNGLTAPIVGALADQTGRYSDVFLIGGVSATLAIFLTLWSSRSLTRQITEE